MAETNGDKATGQALKEKLGQVGERSKIHKHGLLFLDPARFLGRAIQTVQEIVHTS